MMIAVIPARGGSKRIPRKNIRLFAGKPMIAYAIEAARRSNAFDRVIVSTDDDEIAAIAEQHGADIPFRRPSELADDMTPTVPVVQHAIDACARAGMAATHVCCIYPCVPLIDPGDLVKSRDMLMAAGGEGYAFPVARFPSPIQRALRKNGEDRVEPFDPDRVRTRTQDLEEAFFDVAQFYWGSIGAWMAGGSPHQGGHALILPGWRVVDIDTLEDWDRAERLYAAFGT
jgi:pseudaminic acid cytidylyltransferase